MVELARHVCIVGTLCGSPPRVTRLQIRLQSAGEHLKVLVLKIYRES